MRQLALLFALLTAAVAAKADAPNVLFIAVDDLNDWIEPMGGHPQANTPNFARLARRSTLFSRAYTAAPACNPSRAALMTGVAPYRSGVYQNDQAWRPAMPDVETLPQAFMRNGYWAGGSGKIYHGVYPDPASWHEFWPSKSLQREDDPLPAKRPANGISGTGNFDWGPLEAATGEMSDAKVAAWVSAKLGETHAKPFFLACGIFRPHLPWYVPSNYFRRFPLERIELPLVFNSDLADVPQAGLRMARPERDHASVVEHGQWKRAVQAYLASMSFADDMLGRVLDALDESGYTDNTIIVLWGRPRLAFGREAPLAQVCLVGRGHPGAADDLCAAGSAGAGGGHPRRGCLAETGESAGSLSNAAGVGRLGPCRRAGRAELGPAVAEPRVALETGRHDPWPLEPRSPIRGLPLHPLRRRQRGTLRPPGRSDGMDQLGRRRTLRRREAGDGRNGCPRPMRQSGQSSPPTVARTRWRYLAD